MKKIQMAAGAAMLALAASAAQAATVYDNGTAALGSDGNETTMWQQANDFTLASTALVNGATVYIGAESPLAPESLQYYFYADDAGLPGAVVASGSTTATFHDTGVAWISGDVYSMTFSSNEFTAQAGQTYFLGIHLGDSYGTRQDVYWVTTDAPVDHPGVENFENSGGWFNNGSYHAFSISAVPEPTNALLMLAGLGAVVGVARRRRAV